MNLNLIPLIKKNAAIFSRHPLQSGGFVSAIDFADAAGHVVPTVDCGGGATCRSADDECFRIADRSNARARKIAARHQKFVRRMTEVRHGWTVVEGSGIAYADNSEVVTEVSKLTGATRVVTLVSPHGDICF